MGKTRIVVPRMWTAVAFPWAFCERSFLFSKGGGFVQKLSQKWTRKKGCFSKRLFEVKWTQHFRQTYFSQCRKGEPGKNYPKKFFEVHLRSDAGLLELWIFRNFAKFRTKNVNFYSLAPLPLATMSYVWYERQCVLAIDENLESASSRYFREIGWKYYRPTRLWQIRCTPARITFLRRLNPEIRTDFLLHTRCVQLQLSALC